MRHHVRGFTLLELIVVIAIIGVLSVVILPSFTSSLAKSKAAKVIVFSTSLDKMYDSMIGRWDIDETSGTTVKDLSGNNNNGTISGSISFSTDTYSSSSGSSLSFNASDGSVRVDIPGAAYNFIGTQPFSVSMWVKPSSTTQIAYGRFISTEAPGPTGGGFVISRTDIDNRVLVGLWNVRVYQGVSSNTVLADGVWQHLVVVWNGSVVKIYHNGSLDKTGSPMSGPTNNGNMPLSFGSGNGTVIGLMDNIKIYNAALLSGDVQRLYAQGLSSGRFANK